MFKRLFVTFSTAVALISCATPVEDNKFSTEAYPEFSWDHVPVCIHLSRVDADLTPEQIEFMAEFPIICIEKSQGAAVHKYTDFGTEKAAEDLIKVNPKTKVLYYWNSRIDYGDLYSSGRILSDENNNHWAMKNLDDEYVTVQGGARRTYDITLPEVRDWWVQTPQRWLKDENIGGVFIDALIQFIANPPIQTRNLGAEKFESVQKDLFSMLADLKSTLRDDQIIIGNFIRGNPNMMADYGTRFYDYADGAMMEHFASLSGSSKEQIARDIELIADAAKREKMIIVKGWPRFNFTNISEHSELSEEDREAILKEDIEFPLACFLAGAGKYAYFCYSWGYRETHGGLVDYPEYRSDLGEPLGDAVRDGWVYTRSFKHADVWVDIENKQSKITWK